MGMFDTIFMKAKCPCCGVYNKTGFQTKDLANLLKTYHIGDMISSQFRYVQGLGKCEKCQDFFYIRIFVDDEGKITGKYEVDE